jgi:hypothetical protein
MQEDAVWDALARALSGEYEIITRLGLGRGGAPVYLARELVTDTLVALKLPPLTADTEAREFGLEVVRQIDSSLPAIETRCSQCGSLLRQWARFCTRCGRDISGIVPGADGKSRDDLRRLARETGAGTYEMIGDMTRTDGGGMVYFGRDRSTGQIVGLRLETGPEARLLLTPATFAATDPSIQIPAARRPSDTQAARRQATPGAPRISVPARPGQRPAGDRTSRKRRGATIVIVAVLAIAAAAAAYAVFS